MRTKKTHPFLNANTPHDSWAHVRNAEQKDFHISNLIKRTNTKVDVSGALTVRIVYQGRDEITGVRKQHDIIHNGKHGWHKHKLTYFSN